MDMCTDGFEFLWPRSHLYDQIDILYEVIVEELQRRNFEVPGIKVSFSEYGSGEQRLRVVEELRGEDFVLRSGRHQGELEGGVWDDVAALWTAIIPGLQLELGDLNTIWVYRYCGNDWEKDREKFIQSQKYHARQSDIRSGDLTGKGKFCVRYAGESPCHYVSEYRHSFACRPDILRPADDDGREYLPAGDEPWELATEEILQKFVRYLLQNAFHPIVSQPLPRPKELFPVKTLTVFPREYQGRLFCFAEKSKKVRIEEGRRDKNRFPEPLRYALSRVRCGISDKPLGPKTDLNALRIPGEDRQHFVLAVKPAWLEDISVTDRSAFEACKKKCFDRASAAGKDRITEADLRRCETAQQATRISFREYVEKKMRFAKPVVSIDKELRFHEVKPLGENDCPEY